MEVKPGYKQTELGVLPEDWELKSIDQIGNPVRGGSPRPAGDPRYFNGSYIPWLTVAGLTNIPTSRIVVKETATCLTEEGSMHSRTLFPGMLIIANSGATLGVAKILGIKCCANDGIAAILDLSKAVSANYLAHFINTKTNYLREIVATGNGQPNLNTDLIGNFKIPLPPTKIEQEAIAEALSDADALIEAIEQLIAKKRHVKQGAMQELLTGKKRLPGFDGEWETKSLREFADIDPENLANNTDAEFAFNYIALENVEAGRLQGYSEQVFRASPSRARRLLRDSDLLVATVRPNLLSHLLIHIASQVWVCSTGFCVVRCRKGVSVPAYLFFHLFADGVMRQIDALLTGSSYPAINSEDVRGLQIPVPPYEEQAAIAVVLSDMDAEIAALESKLAKARLVKQGIMQDLLTGKVRLIQPEKAEAPSTGHNWAFNEAVVISVLAKSFGSEQYPLGRKRYTKLAYLMHRHHEHQAEGYLKKAAGPYNPATRYKGPEGIAVKNGYMRQHQRAQFSGFIAGDKIADAESYFSKWYGDAVLAWLEQFRRAKNDELELLATVDMGMEDLRRAGKPVDLAGVKGIIREHPEWEAKLDRDIFSDLNITRAIKRCGTLFG